MMDLRFAVGTRWIDRPGGKLPPGCNWYCQYRENTQWNGWHSPRCMWREQGTASLCYLPWQYGQEIQRFLPGQWTMIEQSVASDTPGNLWFSLGQ